MGVDDLRSTRIWELAPSFNFVGWERRTLCWCLTVNRQNSSAGRFSECFFLLGSHS